MRHPLEPNPAHRRSNTQTLSSTTDMFNRSKMPALFQQLVSKGYRPKTMRTLRRYLALENRCPHSGDPLADGMVVDTTVTCGLHHWRICLETGLVIKPCIEGTPQVRTFPVEERDGVVMLGVDAVQTVA
jgi:nitrite reductase/ring-hydroxylating ferredoxin subunit